MQQKLNLIKSLEDLEDKMKSLTEESQRVKVSFRSYTLKRLVEMSIFEVGVCFPMSDKRFMLLKSLNYKPSSLSCSNDELRLEEVWEVIDIVDEKPKNN